MWFSPPQQKATINSSQLAAAVEMSPLRLMLEGTPVEITQAPKRKQAVGRLRNGVITVTVPQRWPQTEQVKASLSLARRLLKDKVKENQVISAARATEPCITLSTEEELVAYVAQVNAETFQAKLNGVQFGWARYSRLAQLNCRTLTMTVSPYCTQQVPEAALRYLIIHELAHTLEANHSARFWRQVARFCPDWKAQSRVIKAFHAHNVQQATPALTTPTP